MGRGGQQQSSGQGSMDLLYISIFFVLLIAGLWYYQHATIVDWLYRLKIYELNAVIWVMSKLNPLLKQFGWEGAELTTMLAIREVLLQASSESVQLKNFWNSIQSVGIFLAYPVFAVSLLMMVFVNLFSVANRFNIIYNMDKLKAIHQSLWPYITPVAKLSLVDESLDQMPWGMSKRPLEFCEQNNILIHTTVNGRPSIAVDEGMAEKVFSLQMGPLWKGLDSLPPHAQALFAIFAAKAEKDTAGAKKLLEQIAYSSSNQGKLDFSGTRELLSKHVRNSKVIGRAVGPHGYILTVMASMLEAARTDGVLATAEFLWLKPIDRPLWYMLSSVGRQTAFSEVAGPFSHWLIEKRLRRPLKVPNVVTAISALKEAIADIKYNPDGF
ncbi:MAG: hypothetical protein CMF51_04145 [Legionellales bacterium]|nr:hypothetical protein [Legionellales bacterium]